MSDELMLSQLTYLVVLKYEIVLNHFVIIL